MASPFTEVNFRPPFPLRATRVSIQFVRYLTRHASILQYNLFDISPRFAEFKPLNLPKLNKKFTHAKRKSRQKPPQNAHFCTVFGTSKIAPSVPKTPRNPARRTPPQTPPQPRQASRKRPPPHPHTPPPEAVRNPARGACRTAQTPRPRPAQTTPNTPSQTSRRPAQKHHARRRETPQTRPSSPRSARCGTPALPGLARRSEPPSGRCRTAPRDEPRDERGKVARAITYMRACARLYNFFIFYYIYYLLCVLL